MTRDNTTRLERFIQHEIESDYSDITNKDIYNVFSFKRMALNMDQVKKYAPPPNPAKFTDSRAEGYVRTFGKSSWELDALEPKVISAIIKKEIKNLITSEEAWNSTLRREEKHKKALNKFGDTFKD